MTEPCCNKNVSDSKKDTRPASKNSQSIIETNTILSFRDTFNGWKVRWGINRMGYKVDPGLYRLGTPKNSSPVLVTANYKLTFDCLRKELTGIDVWILVLNTKGVNVWCAAGKGTFGTEELIHRIADTKLDRITEHKTLILPQLGAPGVSAHKVKKDTGFHVIYGPVYAKDIKHFIKQDLKATPEMRKVRFGVKERLAVTPMEIVPALKFLPLILLLLIFFRLLDRTGINAGIWTDFIPYLGAFIAGTIMVQILLPWIPVRSFALKGALLGALWALLINRFIGFSFFKAGSHLLILPGIVAYLSLNFTGASTFTSLSGVLKEVKIAIPLIITSAAVGLLLRAAMIFY